MPKVTVEGGATNAQEPVECANCGAQVAPGAPACPECRSPAYAEPGTSPDGCELPEGFTQGPDGIPVPMSADGGDSSEEAASDGGEDQADEAPGAPEDADPEPDAAPPADLAAPPRAPRTPPRRNS